MDGKKESFKSIDFIVFAGGLLVTVYLTYHYAYMQMLEGGANDYYAHVHLLLSQFLGEEWWRGWMAAPHCMWHISVIILYKLFAVPLSVSAASVTAFYTGLYYVALLWFIKKISEKFSDRIPSVFSALTALGFCFLQPMYFSFLDAGERYLGVFSMNPIHNPTHMSARVFILLAFCLVVDIVSYNCNENYKPVFFDVVSCPRKYYVWLTVILFVSVVMKPTFAEMFIPAVGLYMLGAWIFRIVKHQKPFEFFKKLLVLFLCAIPAVIYIFLQFAAFFIMGGSYNNEGSIVVTEYLEVWSLFTDNVYLSVLLAMALPIYMLIIDFKYFVGTVQGKIALIGYGTGFLEAALLGEEGSRLLHANFMWPLMAAMLLVWLVSLWRLMELTFANIANTDESSLKKWLVIIGWGLFIVHVLYGITFYRISMMGL